MCTCVHTWACIYDYTLRKYSYGVFWCVLVCFGVVWCGMVWYTMVWLGLVWYVLCVCVLMCLGLPVCLQLYNICTCAFMRTHISKQGIYIFAAVCIQFCCILFIHFVYIHVYVEGYANMYLNMHQKCMHAHAVCMNSCMHACKMYTCI